MEFVHSSADSIGMELEFQLLDENSLDLVDGVLPLMELSSDNEYLTPEFIQNTIEIASRKCFSIKELDSHFHDVASRLNQDTKSLGMRLCGAGTHPFSTRMAHVTPEPRFLEMEKAEKYLSHTQITFATHIHLGMPSAEDAITMMRLLKPYLPLIMAISANSPFWHGHKTGYASYRHRILGSTRSYGMPPDFNDWQEFETFFETARSAGIFNTFKDIHWDARPRPTLGTLEIRVMDAQTTVTDAVLRAAFVQALVFYLRERNSHFKTSPRHEYDYWLEKDNLYQASHLALAAQQTNTAMLHGSFERVVGLDAIWKRVFNDVVTFIQGSSTYSESIDLSYLHTLRKQLGNLHGYLQQLQDFDDELSLTYVTRCLVDRMEEDLNTGKAK